MARAIVRFSLNRDINGPNTNAIRKALESHGIANIGTSVYEGYADMKNVTDALRQTLRRRHPRPDRTGSPVGPCWVHRRPVSYGQQRAGADTE